MILGNRQNTRPSVQLRYCAEYLSIPAQRQVLGIIDDLIVLILALALAQLLLLFLLALLARARLLSLHILVGQLTLLLWLQEASLASRGKH